MGKKLIKVIVPIMIILISFGMLFINNLGNELSLPNEDWSREIDLPLTTGNASPFIAEENGQYHIYGINKDNRLDHLVIDEELNVINKSTLDVDMPPLKPFWAKGDDVVFIRDNNLILFSAGQESTLAENIDGLTSNNNLLIYWQDTKIYTIEEEYNSILINKTTYPIEEVVLDTFSSDNLLVVTKPKVSLFQFTLLQQEKDSLYIAKDIYTLTTYPGETISDFYFAANESTINIVYTAFSIKQGVIKYNNYFSEMNLNQINAEPNFERVKIYETDSEIEMESPKYLELIIKNDTSTLIISSSGYYSQKKKAINIYEAKKINGKWVAERRSKTKDMSVKPEWLSNNTLVWIDYVGNNSYDLKGASTNPNVIEKSQKVKMNDSKFAVSDTLLGLIVSLVVSFNALVWIIPPTVLIIILLIFDINLVERNVRWVRVTAIILYLVTQFFSHKNIFNYNFSRYAPDYMNFHYNYIIIPLILAAISCLYRASIRDDEWDSIKEVSVFIGINLLMYILLLGPYIL